MDQQLIKQSIDLTLKYQELSQIIYSKLPNYQEAVNLKQQYLTCNPDLKQNKTLMVKVDMYLLKFLQDTEKVFDNELQQYQEIFSYFHYYIFNNYVDDIHQIWKQTLVKLKKEEKTDIINSIKDKYEQIHKQEPKNINNLFCWGNTLLNLQEVDQAIEKFSLSIEINPNNSEAYRAWGDCYESKGKYEESIEKLKIACKLDQQNESAFHNLAYVQSEIKLYDEALKNFQISAELNPNDYLTYYNIARCYEDMGDKLKCVEYYEKAIELNDTKINLIQDCGEIYYDLEKYEDALRLYKLSLNLDNKDDDMLNNIGVCLQQLQKFQESIQYFQDAININKDVLSYHINLANSYIDLNLFEKANEILDYAMKTDIKDKQPKLLELYQTQGRCYYLQNDLDKSLHFFQQALKIDENNVDTLRQIADLQFDIENFEASEQTILRILEIEPNNLQNLCFRGITMLRQQRNDEGIEYFQKLNKQYPNQNCILDGIASGYYNKNQYEQAQVYYIQALISIIESKNNWKDTEPYDTVLQRQFEEYLECLQKFPNPKEYATKTIKKFFVEHPQIYKVFYAQLKQQTMVEEDEELQDIQELFIFKNYKILQQKVKHYHNIINIISPNKKHTNFRLLQEIKQFKKQKINKMYRKEIIKEVISFLQYKSCIKDSNQQQQNSDSESEQDI